MGIVHGNCRKQKKNQNHAQKAETEGAREAKGRIRDF